MEIDLTNVPIILAYSNPNSDFANFAGNPTTNKGWSDCNLSKLSEMSIANFQDLSKKWIHSAAEKVDLWSVAIKLGEVINVLLSREESKNSSMGNSRLSKQVLSSKRDFFPI